MIIGEKETSSINREGFSIGSSILISSNGNFPITKLPIFNNKLKVSSLANSSKVKILGDNGEFTTIPVYKNFPGNMFMLMEKYPSIYFFDKNGYLNGIWELDCKRSLYTKTGKDRINVHRLVLKPSPFRELGKFEMSRDSIEDWFMKEYDLEKAIV